MTATLTWQELTGLPWQELIERILNEPYEKFDLTKGHRELGELFDRKAALPLRELVRGCSEQQEAIADNHPHYPSPAIPKPNDPGFKALQKQWYALAGYSVEQDEYRVEPQQFGSQDRDTYPWMEERETREDTGWYDDDEDMSDVFELEPTYDEDAGYDLVAEVEQFVNDVAVIAGLTLRERQVIEWIASGNSVAGDYAPRMADALGVSVRAVQSAKARALTKLREHWAGDMEAQGLVDPRYLDPIRHDEFVCSDCHLIKHQIQQAESGRCIECEDA